MAWQSIRGHERAIESLRGLSALGRLPHAFLFVGPEGVGKRTVARAFAQALLCAKPAGADPCGDCTQCRQVLAGAHPDLLAVGKPDDKHELPISLIRDLCRDLSLTPMSAARRVAIVDDADDLSTEAANAFLKTLEEPPPGSILILIGTAAELQLETIVSRCRVVTFDGLSDANLAAILLDRRLAADETEARRLAEAARGSVARARGLTDAGLAEFRRGLIDELAAPGGFDPPSLARRMEAFVREGAKESVQQRARADLLVGELAECFRSVLRQTAGLEPPANDPLDRESIGRLAARLEPEDVFLLAERCLEAEYQIRRKAYLSFILDSFLHDLGRVINAKTG